MPKVLGFTGRLCEEATMKALMMRVVLGEVLLVFFLFGPAVLAAEVQSPEEVLRALVKANADRDLSTMARLMAHDADIVSYTIGGRKYVGWPQLERDMVEEFQMVARLEMPITALRYGPAARSPGSRWNSTTSAMSGTIQVSAGWSSLCERPACSNAETVSGSCWPGTNPSGMQNV